MSGKVHQALNFMLSQNSKDTLTGFLVSKLYCPSDLLLGKSVSTII